MLIKKADHRDTLGPSTLVISIANYGPPPRYDNTPWTDARIEGTMQSEEPFTWSSIDTFTFSDPDTDPTEPKNRSFTVTVSLDTIFVRVVMVDGAMAEAPSDPIAVSPSLANLITMGQVEQRLGRDLNEDEEKQVDSLIMLSTISIYASIGQGAAWQPKPAVMPFMRLMAIEVVCRGMVNPGQLFQRSETIGGYSYSELYTPRGEKTVPGLFLTPAETLVLRQVVFGTNTGSYKVRSFADDYAELIWPYQVQYGLYYGNLSDPVVWK